MRIPILGPILAVLNPNRPVSPPILHKNGLQSVENSTINNPKPLLATRENQKLYLRVKKNILKSRGCIEF